MQLKFDMNTALFRAACKDAAEKLGANSELLIKEEARFVIRDFMKVTPPFAAGGFGKSIGTTADKKAGEGAIRKDVGSVAVGADTGFIDFVSRTFGRDRIKQFLTPKEGGKPYELDWDKIVTSLSSLREFHLSKRNRYGRTPKSRNVRSQTLWRASGSVVAPREVVAQYIKELTANVGAEKGVFSNAAARLGQSMRPWFKRGQGSYSEGRGPSFFIQIGGRTQRPAASRQLVTVVRKRGEAMTREVARMMKSLATTGKILTRRKSFNQE